MTTPSTTHEFIENLQSIQERARKLEGELSRLGQSLRRYNVRLSDAFNDLLWGIQSEADRAGRLGQEVLTRLEQLQELVRTSALISTSLDLENVLERVLDTVIALTMAERAYLVLRDPETGDLSISAARNWDHERLRDQDFAFSHSIVQAAFVDREPIITTDAQQDERFSDAHSVVQQGLRAVLCIPLLVQTHVVGALYCDNRMTKGTFSRGSVPLLLAFGTQAAIAIEKARLHEAALAAQKLEEELELGRRIQLSMMPRTVPAHAGWTFAAAYQAARQVGGDFYDFFPLPGDVNTLGIVVADVSDKGVPAALFMAQCRTMIRTSTTSQRSPGEALRHANALLQQDGEAEMFLTCFYAMLNLRTGQLVYANAGHNRPLWYHDGAFYELRAKGVLLGMIEPITLEEVEVGLDYSDVVVFYTDGVTEAMNEVGDLFGVERLQAIVAQTATLTVDEIQAAILDGVAQFVGDAPPSDDVTLVVLKRA